MVSTPDAATQLQKASISMLNTNMQGGMAEATRLTQAGRLQEATALIQRTLGNGTASDTSSTDSWGSSASPGATIPTTAPLVSRPGQRGSGPVFPRITDPTPSTPRAPRRKPKRAPERVTTQTPADTLVTGQFVSGSFTNNAGTRSYKLYVPGGAGRHTDQTLPLIVMLHGCTQNPDDYAAGTGMNALAEGGKFFVVYPEQAGSANMQRCWNWFQAGDQRRGQGEPSIIAGITREILTTQPVDPHRVYVAGMSAGGAMAAIMAATYPDLYAAAGVHSGLAYGAAHDMPSAFRAMKQGAPDAAAGSPNGLNTPAAKDLTRAIPTIVFHGDRDNTVNLRNGEQVLRQWSGADAAQAKGRATVRQGQVNGGRAYTHSVFLDGDGNSMAERWIVHGAGHAWSGGDPRGSYTDPKGPDASGEMVRFFLEHPTPKFPTD